MNRIWHDISACWHQTQIHWFEYIVSKLNIILTPCGLICSVKKRLEIFTKRSENISILAHAVHVIEKNKKTVTDIYVLLFRWNLKKNSICFCFSFFGFMLPEEIFLFSRDRTPEAGWRMDHPKHWQDKVIKKRFNYCNTKNAGMLMALLKVIDNGS